MVQNEINNMSFLTADNKSKMAKVGASLWEVDLARREGTPPELPSQLSIWVTFPAALLFISHFLLIARFIPYPPFLSPNFSELPSSGF